MYWRLSVDQIAHTRTVYHFFDFIGDLGGTPAIMLQLCGWVVGSFAAFNASYAFVSQLYKYKGAEKIFMDTESNEKDSDLSEIRLSVCQRYLVWSQTTICAFFCKCCKSEKTQKVLDVLDKGNENTEADFDIYDIIHCNKDLR